MGHNGSVLFEMVNKNIEEGFYVSTGIKLFENNIPFSLILDYTKNSNPTTGNARFSNLFCCWSSSLNKWILCVNKESATAGFYRSSMYGNPKSLSGTKPTSGRNRMIITHEANSNKITIYYKYNNGNLLTFEHTYTFTSDSSKMALGASPSTGQGMPAGTITLARILGEVLNENAINNFFA